MFSTPIAVVLVPHTNNISLNIKRAIASEAFSLTTAVAGIMVFVTFDGLLPMAHKYGEEHWSLYGLVAGMFLMALGLAVV